MRQVSTLHIHLRGIGRCAIFLGMIPSSAKQLPTRGPRRRKLTTTPERSQLMSRVRQHGTQPERAVRGLARRLGYRLSTNVRSLPGSPDLCHGRLKKAVFVHGCFWHRHPQCSAATTPKNNRDYWVCKFKDNVARDARKQRDLRRLRYQTMTIWTCELRGTTWEKRLGRKLERFLGAANTK